MPPRALPSSSDVTCVLGIRDAGVVDLLCDPVAMAVWDVLRASRAVRSVSEVSTAALRTPAEAQRAIDRLVESGLVAMRRARGRRTAVGYVARYRSVVVAHEPEQDGDLVERVLAAMADAASRAHQPSPRASGRFVAAAPLDRAAREELHRRIMDVVDYMRSLGMAPVPSTGGGPESGDTVAIRAVIDLAPLAAGPGIRSSVALLPRSALAGVDGRVRARAIAEGALTRREWDVAAALASGASRPEIAQRLGISTNTVASIAKSVYRKCGVHSRSQLSMRFRGMPPTMEPGTGDDSTSIG